MNNEDLEGLDSSPINGDGSVKVREKFKALHIADEPVQKKLKIADERMLIPTHNCEEEQPEFQESSEVEERCCSCGRISVGPYISPECGHVFGTAAIKALERESITSFHCPGKDFDNEPCIEIVETSQLKPDRALYKTILKKSVKCINANLGCTSSMLFKSHKSHIENECQYANVKCPSCTELFQRHLIAEHTKDCRSQTCEFAELGCSHVTSSERTVASSASRQHSAGLHMALILQSLFKSLAMAKFSTKSVDSALTERSKDLTGQDETLHMMNHLDQTRTEAMHIEELRTNYVNKRVDTKNHLQNYNAMLNNDFALQVAEPGFRMRTRSQYLERQEEDISEDVKKLLKDTIEIPILLNQGSIIFKVTNFSDKRTKAIKGELKRGVYGPQFYTHEYGYLMIPILYPNGDGAGAGTHLSIFIAIKKGKFDSLLPWPIMGRITISVLSQKRVGREAVRHSFRTDVASLSYHRPTSDMNQASGIPKALELNLLKQPSDYLVDDTLFIQIVVDPKLPDK